MKEYKKQLPIIDGDGKEFWEGCKKHRLTVQRCKDCGTYRYPPRIVCSKCLSDNTEWVVTRGMGTIYSYVVSYQAFGLFGPEPGWKEELPFISAVADMDEGFKMPGQVIDCRPDQVAIGIKIETIFDDVTEDVTLPKFKLTSGQ